ncbi:MAG: alpha/beta hydrolase [Ilumatobacteraceae bacterium]
MTDLEREYSPSSRVGGSADPFIAAHRARSAAVREELGDRVIDIENGSLLVTASPTAPVFAFIHGGYWQALSASESLYLAPGALAHGWSYLAIDYTLAPDGTLPQMISQCRAALAALARHVMPPSVVLAGHSAGAHLAAMVSLVRQPPFPIERTVLVSGVFDLRPLVRTTVNAPLGLDVATAAALSPRLLPARAGARAVVAWGDNDTGAFAAQSRGYSAHLTASGASVSSFECPGRHHFDIVDDLVEPLTALGRATLFGD